MILSDPNFDNSFGGLSGSVCLLPRTLRGI